MADKARPSVSDQEGSNRTFARLAMAESYFEYYNAKPAVSILFGNPIPLDGFFFFIRPSTQMRGTLRLQPAKPATATNQPGVS
jgi:hypothetical protein